MSMKYISLLLNNPNYDYQDFCQGGTIANLTLEDTLGAGIFTEDDIEDMLNLNIITSSDDSYTRNTEMDTQEFDSSKTVNLLIMCTNWHDMLASLMGVVKLQEGETSENFCRGSGTLGGLTYEEHKNNNTDLYTFDLQVPLILKELSELITFNKILLNVNLPYFEFTIDGKNTYPDQNIEYEIVLNNSDYNGEDKETRNERIDDKFLKFALVEVVGEQANLIFHNKSYYDLENATVFTDSISSSDGEIDRTYRLYMWIGDEVVIGGGDVDYDYDMEIWSNKIYASVRVDINANFVPKDISNQTEIATDSASFKRIANNKGTTYVEPMEQCI